MADRLSVVLATAERPDLLARTLRSLSECDKPRNYVETVVVENGPRRGVEKIVAGFADALNARYLHAPEKNKSRALNLALSAGVDGLIVFTDDDARFCTDFLKAYAAAAIDVEGGVFFGGAVDVDYTEAPPAWLIGFLPASARGWRQRNPLKASPRRPFLGINWAAFAGDVRRVGEFNPDLGPGSPTGARGQESEAQLRLARAGCVRRYVPDAVAWHFVPPERCSPSWAIERCFREGLYVAVQLCGRNRFDVLVRQQVALARRLPWFTRSMARISAPLDFRKRFVRAYWEGFRQGARLVGNGDRLRAMPPSATR